MTFLRFLWRRHPFATVVFMLAVIVMLTFGAGFARDALYFHDPAHSNQTLEPWMTPRYVSMSWDLPPEVIGPLMGLTKDMPRDGNPPRLDQIAATLGITLDELQTRVEAAKSAFDARRRDHVGPGGPPPPQGQGADQ